ncbi:MAG: hypothetical protein KKD64_01680 [Alphaproteobacteria bacterium]|nr:hypothetical protein [Alphaproteobacteria bacterium]MBU0794434.1 hypothetical protein [Alphaproteobacteria bacterium]MBU0874826.1 hypothetical protein [Alphaproteobacteria bacterium]MBU1768351.1 hypothetical protein [Alphaproteobacteria bacterium]
MRNKVHRWHAKLMAAAGAALLSTTATPATAQAFGERSAVNIPTCDRDCLIGYARDYMAALAKKDPSALKLADDVQFTENNVVIPVGKGLWSSISKVAPTGLEAADPLTGQVAWFGVVWEHGEPAYYAMRMRVRDEKIDQIETVVHRRTGLPAPFGDPDKVKHHPAFNEVLPPERRVSRARLIAVAQSYFNTVERNDGTVFAPFTEDCGRLENGISTTAPGKGVSAEPGGGGNAASLASGCLEQFKLGIYYINKRIRERRFPLVDEERGVVVASGFFDHDNEVDTYKLTDGRDMKTALKWPNSITLLEAFRVRDGAIQEIEAVFTYVPYFMHNPWATGREHGEQGE